jgi:hypothetical protein
MVGKTYTNAINEMEVNMAIERLLVADYPTAWTPKRIDIDDLATTAPGFYDMGAVVEDSPSFRASREKYTLETGIPMIRQFENVTRVDGTMEITLHTNHWRKIQYAMGNFTYQGSFTTCGTITSVNNTNATFIASFTNDCTIGDQVVFATTEAKFQDPDALESKIASANLSTSEYKLAFPTYKDLADDMFCGLYGDEADTDTGFQYMAVGGATIRYFALLGVADFLDGVQVIHKFAKVAPAEEFLEEINPTETGRTALTFNAFGTSSTSYGGSSQLIVAERFYFPAREGI